MKNYLFILSIFLVILTSFSLHIYAIRDNHFFFTVDQGNDAVNIREIVLHKKIPTTGPVTGVGGIYAGPGWYFLNLPAFILTQGHPIYSPLTVISLNIFLTVLLMVVIKNRIGIWQSIFVGILIQFFWGFFETSLYGFNPFPLVLLSFLLILFLIKFLEGEKKYYTLAGAVIVLGFNAEIAGSVTFLLLYLLIGIYSVHQKTISKKQFLLSNLLVFILGILPIMINFISVKAFNIQIPKPSVGSGEKVFGATSFTIIYKFFWEEILASIFPLSKIFAFFLLLLVSFISFVKKDSNKFVFKFVFLSALLILVSFVFFSSNSGFRDWHVPFLAPITFVSFLFVVFSFSKRLLVPILLVVSLGHLISFSEKYLNYLRLENDNGLLSNKIKAVDWIYKNSEENGFNLYTYTDTFFDYPYQYLLWWHGKSKYGYVPCEYSNYPYALKNLYVPGYTNYSIPTLGCEKLRFLIIESGTNGAKNSDWIDKFRNNNNLIDSYEFNSTKIEKYYKPNESPTDECVWKNVC